MSKHGKSGKVGLGKEHSVKLLLVNGLTRSPRDTSRTCSGLWEVWIRPHKCSVA